MFKIGTYLLCVELKEEISFSTFPFEQKHSVNFKTCLFEFKIMFSSKSWTISVFSKKFKVRISSGFSLTRKANLKKNWQLLGDAQALTDTTFNNYNLWGGLDLTLANSC